MAYIIQTAESSRCPLCNGKVDLLCPGDLRKGPMFYICFDCKTVAKVGVGPVKREE
jgi:DNA-directed RNA polymerase subunit RPC12/RpoP